MAQFCHSHPSRQVRFQMGGFPHLRHISIAFNHQVGRPINLAAYEFFNFAGKQPAKDTPSNGGLASLLARPTLYFVVSSALGTVTQFLGGTLVLPRSACRLTHSQLFLSQPCSFASAGLVVIQEWQGLHNTHMFDSSSIEPPRARVLTSCRSVA